MTIAALTSKSPYAQWGLGGRVPIENWAELERDRLDRDGGGQF